MGTPRVVVVTGGAIGIGAAIAEHLGRIGSYVVTLDPYVSVDGSTPLAPTGPTTAERIVAAGGKARASNASVTDGDAVRALFARLVDELGSLDAVINVAGISRSTFRPWVEHCLDAFGVSRCMFASNFPVDGMHGSFDDFFATYDALTADLNAVERDQVFASTAERIYRC